MSRAASLAATAQVRLHEDLQRRERPMPARARREEQACSDGGRLTLEQRISRVWEGLHAAGAAECPVCGGCMDRSFGHGRCRDCGSSLT